MTCGLRPTSSPNCSASPPDRAPYAASRAQTQTSQHNPPADAPVLQLGAYEGPLDLLLELAWAQRVDLTRISMVALADAFIAMFEAAMTGRRFPLAQLGDWLVVAAALLALRARLLLPASAPENRAAEQETAALRRRLADREHIRRLAEWLERRPQLGRQVFGRGAVAPEAAAEPAADVTELLRACLKLLELPARERVYRTSPPLLWRVPDALDRIRRLLPELAVDGVSLVRLLPPAEARMATPLQRRAALASTLMAGLELSRGGAATVEQGEAFGVIRIGPGKLARLGVSPSNVAA